MTERINQHLWFGASIAIAIVVGVFALSSWWAFTRSTEEAQATRQILENTNLLRRAVLESESSQRGYVLTGEPQYLEPYKRAMGVIDLYLERLVKITSGRGRQRDRATSLLSLVPEKMAEMKQTIALRDSEGLEAALAIVRSDRGRTAMETIQRICSEIEAEEYASLLENSQTAARRAKQSQIITMLGTAILAILLAASGRKISRAADRREELIAELSDAKQRAEAALEQSQRANEEIQQFAYAASHDLQEPLRMIHSFSQMLGRKYDDKLDEEGREFLALILEGATRMEALLSALLEYSRIGYLRDEPLEAVSFEKALEEVTTSLRLAMEESGAVVTHDALPTAPARAIEVQQLLQNLISNAIKYRGEKPPRVHVSCSRADGGWTFSVRDNGIGIEPNYRDKVFGVFERLHGREVPGTGIGLATCKKIVENHGGKIWVESTAGEGSTFLFTMRG